MASRAGAARPVSADVDLWPFVGAVVMPVAGYSVIAPFAGTPGRVYVQKPFPSGGARNTKNRRKKPMKRAIRLAAAVACLFTAILAAAPMAMAQNAQTLPLVLPAGGPRDSLVFIINQSARAGTVTIHAIDDTGERFGPVTLSIGANAAARFHSRDLEQGNPDRLSAGIGDGVGNWRLELESDLDFGAMAYVRTSDGFLTDMYDKAPVTEGIHHVLFFNPASNISKQSRLRLINPGAASRIVTRAYRVCWCSFHLYH